MLTLARHGGQCWQDSEGVAQGKMCAQQTSERDKAHGAVLPPLGAKEVFICSGGKSGKVSQRRWP